MKKYAVVSTYSIWEKVNDEEYKYTIRTMRETEPQGEILYFENKKDADEYMQNKRLIEKNIENYKYIEVLRLYEVDDDTLDFLKKLPIGETTISFMEYPYRIENDKDVYIKENC